MTKENKQKKSNDNKTATTDNLTNEIQNPSLHSDPAVNYKYKDTLFRFIFNNRERLLGLYNALNHSDYTNADELEINTLENVVYLSMKNDLSFIFDFRLYIFEHQSTYCPNMPLRDLHYVSTLLEGLIPKKYLYSSKLLKIPTPHFVVFYNGETKLEDRKILKLSDMYEKQEEHPELELKVTLLNINYGQNEELMELCKDLRDYSIYVHKVRTYSKTMEIKDAVRNAIKECVENDILAEILTKFRSEAEMLSLMEYDKELHEQTIMEDSFDDGVEVGLEIGELKNLLNMIRKKLAKKKTYETIADELETDLSVVEQIADVIKTSAPDSTSEELVRILLDKQIKLE